MIEWHSNGDPLHRMPFRRGEIRDGSGHVPEGQDPLNPLALHPIDLRVIN
jgi:hypothetical protein